MSKGKVTRSRGCVHRKTGTAGAWFAMLLSGMAAGCSNQATAQAVNSDGSVYEAVVGAGTPVCDAYVAPLKSYGELGAHMRERPPFDFPDLGRFRYGADDEWVFLRKIAQFLWERDINPVNWLPRTGENPVWQGTPEEIELARTSFLQLFEASISNPGAGYRVGRVDIDNDGESDPIFYRIGSLGSTLLVLNKEETDIDVERTERILKHPSRRDAGWPELRPPWPNERARSGQTLYAATDAYSSAQYGMFLFNGRTYVDLWWSQHPEYSVVDAQARGAARVYLTEGKQSREVCVVRLARAPE